MRSEPGELRRDEGTSLLEVLVALAVVTIAMTGLGAFFVNGNLAVAHQRDQRQAVQVAAGGIEQVRGLQGTSVLSGRGMIKSKAQWDAVKSGLYAKKMKRYLDSMAIGWDDELERTDPSSPLGNEAAIPTKTQTITVGSSKFNREMLIGRCVVYFMRNDDCVNPNVGTPPSNNAEILRYFRVVVLVTWTGKSCESDRCTYVASTLIAQSTEPTFYSKAAPPVMMSTEMSFYVGREITQKIDVDGGQVPNVLTVTAPSTLPSWIKMSPGGYVTGNPTVAAQATSVVRVTDKRGWWNEKTITWKAVLPPSVVVPAQPKSFAGQQVNYKVTAVGGVPAYVFTAPKDLPEGLELAADGTITGSIAKLGAYPITVTVEDANGVRDTKTFTHTVSVAEPLSLTALPDQKINLGSAVTGTAVAKGGSGQYTYTATGLPAGVTINAASGVLSGSPVLVAGRYLPTITVSDSAGESLSDTFELVVETTTKLTFTSPSLVGADQKSTVGSDVILPLTTNGDLLLLKNVSLTVTGLPEGLKYNKGKSEISGKPKTAGTYPVKVTANSLLPLPQTATLTFLWTVE
ncbi:putative Ig domain-containing protein [Actinoplanes aureus]|uniref:Ig domain-containing protein n=1 Tax=Actinoplanes aureus TaxID=2792083 RepID=A0A931C4F0_9ACTN|nr:putative Ig domain-containing protein [Actinoplanes aureus]MBG0560392.1 putative Ig domain-containing protein [Actinoplanes aureus]